MKTPLLLVLCATSVGCGVAARSPDMYRDDTKTLIATKHDAILACYDGVLKSDPNAGGKVTVKFNVETETGTLSNVVVDKAGSTAPDAVAECVTKNLGGLALKPADVRKGEATWVFEFKAPQPSATSPTPAKS